MERASWVKTRVFGAVSASALVAGVLGATAGPAVAATAPTSQSGPIKTTATPNWAGYEAKLNKVTDIHAAWRVPAVSCKGSNKSSAMTMWAGIDDKSKHLVQAGTGAACASSKATPVYYSWWESLPANETPVGYVKAGDEMSLDISYYSNDGTFFIIILKDNGSTIIDEEVAVTGEPLSQAECVVEAPLQTRYHIGLPIANYTQLAQFKDATFTDCDVTNSKVAHHQIGLGSVAGLTVDKINMTDTFRTKATVGNPGSGGAPWTVTWRHPD